MKSLLLLFLLIAQQEFRYPAPRELDSPYREMFLNSMRADKYDSQIKDWKTHSDPEHVLSSKVHEELHLKNCAVRIAKIVNPKKESIKQFGLSVDLKLYDSQPKSWQKIAENMRQKLVGTNVSRACDQLGELSAQLHRQLRLETNSLTISVEFRMEPNSDNQAKGNAKSPASKDLQQSAECWMLMEVFPSEKNLPIYPRMVAHKLMLLGARQMQEISPHPMQAQAEKQLAEFLSKPLKANRKSPLEATSTPVPPLLADGLTFEQREDKLNFYLRDNVSSNDYQIEGISFTSEATKLVESSSNLLERLELRLPRGKTVTYEELHRICAEFVEGVTVPNRKAPFVFSIEPYQHGKFVYASLTISVPELE